MTEDSVPESILTSPAFCLHSSTLSCPKSREEDLGRVAGVLIVSGGRKGGGN